MTYKSIALSKEKNAFINEFQPQFPSVRINGRDYYIAEAWVEHPHLEENFRDFLLGAGRCLVVSFHYEQNDSVDLHSYVKEDGNGVARIWFNLSDQEYAKDTLMVHYRETLDSAKKNKVFLLFKKK